MDFLKYFYFQMILNLKACCVVSIDVANVRSGPGTDHEVVCTADKGVMLEIVGREGKWLQVEHANGKSKGWISSNIVWGEHDDERKD